MGDQDHPLAFGGNDLEKRSGGDLELVSSWPDSISRTIAEELDLLGNGQELAIESDSETGFADESPDRGVASLASVWIGDLGNGEGFMFLRGLKMVVGKCHCHRCLYVIFLVRNTPAMYTPLKGGYFIAVATA